ncbi:hypothetical protein BAMA_21155 [Bacillus manliponensis]|uniref:DUF1836 domain-containing protein n=1 Tax=Bacillus manliponensis TaxID=574376 RepID=A0A073JZX1_9BACI|nr:DUF1836 domain-containing protein [Bacillus manliponensis]KEK19752.1 hypothetical protein BAMA_21155 [Bacillus manliponensis]
METFHLTRNEMARLLLSLRGWDTNKPLAILQEAWAKSHKKDIESGESVTAFITTALSPIFEKLIKIEETDIGFSLNEIVALGNQIENTKFSATALQNWVKRDIKEMIGSPQKGKKYSVEQAALLFIVEDLKTALDFESIRKLLRLIVNDPADRSDDLINPVRLYAAYSSLFEELNASGYTQLKETDTIHTIEQIIKEKADAIASTFEHITSAQREAIRNAIIIATLSVHTAYVQMLAKRYVSATLFLQELHIE